MPTDQGLDPGQGPAFVFEAVCRRPLAEFLLEHSELFIGDGRGVRRTRRAQGIHAALAPGTAPAFHGPHTHPQVLRDDRGLLTRREPHAGLKPDPLTKRPTLSGQAPALWIPHLTGIPQGSSTVTTRRQPENLSKRAQQEAAGDPGSRSESLPRTRRRRAATLTGLRLCMGVSVLDSGESM